MNKVITALVTPFANNKVDYDSLERLLSTQIDVVDGVVACSTTGEMNSLAPRERRKILRFVAKYCVGKVTVMTSVDGNDVTHIVRNVRYAEENGADAILVTPPSFVKCTADGYVKIVDKIVSSTVLPVYLYNVPSRCGYNISKQVLIRCKEVGISGIKDCACNKRTESYYDVTSVLCGNDGKLAYCLSHNATGVISVASNVCPVLTCNIVKNYNNLTQETVAQWEQFGKLNKVLCREVNPVAIKYMLYEMGIIDQPTMRLPLTTANKYTINAVKKYLETYGNCNLSKQ